MEGTNKLILREPIAIRRDEVGEPIPIFREHIVWATRVDRGGGVGTPDDVVSDDWDVLFRFRRYPRIHGLNQDWEITDSDGLSYKIETVGRVGTDKVSQQRINRFQVFATNNRIRLEDLPLLHDGVRSFDRSFDRSFGR